MIAFYAISMQVTPNGMVMKERQDFSNSESESVLVVYRRQGVVPHTALV